MPITISGSTGIAGVDGSASTPAVQGTDTNTGIAFPAADTVATTTGGTERMRVDSAGQLGLGTTSPGNRLDVVGAGTSQIRVKDGVNATAYYDFGRDGTDGLFGFSGAQTTFSGYKWSVNAGSEVMRITNGGNVGIGTSSPGHKLQVNGAIVSTDGTTTARVIVSGGVGLVSTITNHPLAFQTNDTERARITSGGDFLVGTASTLFASSHAFVNSGAAVLGLRNSVSTAGKYWQVGPDSNSSFKVYNQSSVGMFMSDGSTSWSSSSDERQKNIIEPISNAVAKVGSLRAVIGSYKSDQENKRRSFLIAQDVEQALPEAVTTAPDGFLGVAYTDVIPLLVAAIQELKAENDDLKARLTALEAK